MSIVKQNNVVFPALLNEFLRPDWFGGTDHFSKNAPSVNIMESEKEFKLEIAAPGLKKEDFVIEVDNDILSISFEVNNETEDQDFKYTRKEFLVESFKRTFTIPETVNVDDIKADYEAGILVMTLGKKEEALPKPKRIIALK